MEFIPMNENNCQYMVFWKPHKKPGDSDRIERRKEE